MARTVDSATSPYGLVALSTVLAMLALTWSPVRTGAASALRAAAVALGAAAKFTPLALAPLFAAAPGDRRVRQALVFVGVLGVVAVAATAPFVPDGGLRELYDRTLGYQVGRPSPFSVWGQVESLDWLQSVVKAGAGGLALLVAFVPRRRGPLQVAALGAAVLISVELAMTHWFYLYVVWFAPLALVALLGLCRGPPTDAASTSARAPAEREPVAA